ncbi:MAG: OmpA family protein [Pseudanabaena sp. ELA645]
MTNSPTPDKSKTNLGKSSDNSGQTKLSAVTFVVRTFCLGISAIAGIGVGLAIAFERPDLVWQPSLNLLNYKKQQFTLSSEALFEVDKPNIRAESFRLLDEIAAQLPLTKGKRVRIAGHTDLNSASSSAGDELTLSYFRANAVKEYLARLRGEQTYYWMVVGYGASRPLTSRANNGNSNANNKSSRRIEIFVED